MDTSQWPAGCDDYNCYAGATNRAGEHGITIWGPSDLSVPPHEGSGFFFTCTKPRCYSGPSFCNLIFTVHTDNSAASSIGPLVQTLTTNSGSGTYPIYHSQIAGHDAYFLQDLVQAVDDNDKNTKIFNDTGQNNLFFWNDSNYTITLKGLQVIHGYFMRDLPCDYPGREGCSCTEDATQSSENDFPQPREDHPCNYATCGGLSFTGYGHDNHNGDWSNDGIENPTGKILHPGTTYQWHWTTPQGTFDGYDTYIAPRHHIFCLNNVHLCDDTGQEKDAINTPDVAFQISLDSNFEHYATFYHCREGNIHMAHAVDLANDPNLKNYLNDAPVSSIDLYLRIVGDPQVNFHLVDQKVGFCDLCRIYQTKPCCPTITSRTLGSGTISPLGGPFGIPQQGLTFYTSANSGYYNSLLQVDGTQKTIANPFTVNWSDLQMETLGMEGHTISAEFAANPLQYTITSSWTSSDGYITPSGPTTVTQGQNQSFTVSAVEGCQIADIIIDNDQHLGPQSNSQYTYTFTNVQNNHLISAAFSPLPGICPVILDISGVISPTATFAIDGVTYSPGIQVPLTAGNHTFSVDPTQSDVYGDYSFAYFDILDGGANHVYYSYCNPASIDVESNTEFLVATYTRDLGQVFTITTSPGSDGSITPSSATVLEGSCATFNITPDIGYYIADVQVNGNSVGAVTQYTVQNIQQNLTVSANFSIQTFSITSSAGTGGTINPSGTNDVNFADSITYTITPNSGYMIFQVTADGADQGTISSYTFSNVQSTHTISVSFAQIYYTISASAGSDGSIIPSGSVEVAAGGSQTFTIIPNSGYSISDVTTTNPNQDLGAASSYTFTNIEGPGSISASFTINAYAITSSTGSGGTISPSGTTFVNYGSNQTYTMTPNAGYSISQVTVDGINQGTIGSYIFSNVQATHSISVSFSQIVYTIAASAGSGGSISPSGSVQVAAGGNQSFVIAANSGYAISQVTVDGQNQGAISSYAFSNVQAAHTISASFAQSGQSTIFQDDFSSGTFNSWTSTTGNPTISNGAAVFSVPTGNGTSCFAEKDNLPIGSSEVFSVTSTVSFNTVPDTGQGNSAIFFNQIADSSALVQASVDGSGHFGLWIGPYPNNIWVYDATNVTANTPYNITVQLDNANQLINLIVNGVTTISQAYTDYSQFQNSSNVNLYAGITSNWDWAIVTVTADNFTVTNNTSQEMTYTITASAGDGGSISPSGSIQVSAGGGQTFTITPNSGYHLSDLTRNGTSVIGNVTNNQYTVSNVNSNETLYATFALDQQQSTVFQDDFSSGTFNAWTSTYGGPTISDDKAIFTVPTGDGTQSYAEKDQLSIDSNDVLSVSMTVSFNTVPNNGEGFSDIFFSGIYDPSSGAIVYALLDGSQHFGLWIGDWPNQIAVYDNTAVQPNTYYNVTIQLDNTNQLVNLIINGQTTITHAYTSYSQFQNSANFCIVDGIVANYDWAVVEVKLDNVIVTRL